MKSRETTTAAASVLVVETVCHETTDKSMGAKRTIALELSTERVHDNDACRRTTEVFNMQVAYVTEYHKSESWKVELFVSRAT